MMLLKLNLLNAKKFLDVAEACKGSVEWVMAENRCYDLSKSEAARQMLRECFEENKKQLRVNLKDHMPQDYFALVSYYTGDC